MKIIHFFATYPNKTQPYNQVLLERLEKENISCEVACLFITDSKSNFKRYNLEHKKSKWYKYLNYTLKFKNEFKIFRELNKKDLKSDIKSFGKYAPLLEAKPDIVHIHHIQILNNTLLNFFRATKIKTIVTVRGSDVLVRPFRDEKHKKFIENVLKNVNYIHAVAGNLAKVVEEFGKPKDKIYTIYRTVEIDEVGFSKKRNSSSKHFNITTIGRVHWTKGYVDAIKSLSLLKLNGFAFTYHICGGYEIELYDELNYWIRRCNLENEVIFHGHVNNKKINELLSETDVYLQCSLTEGVPNTLLRAIHFHIPVVATNAGGIPEVFIENTHGLMVDVGDVNEIARSLQLILSNEVKLKEYQIKEISASKEINGYKAMYNSLLE